MSDEHDELSELFRRLHDAYFTRICAFVRRRGVPEKDAEDCAQEVFLKCYRRCDPSRAETARALLFSIARNHVIDKWRRDRIDAAGREAVPLDAFHATSPAFTVSSETAVGAAFSRLPTDAQELLDLRFWQGLSLGEIALVMGHSVPTASRRVRHAVVQFSEQLSMVGVTVTDDVSAETGEVL